jgi:sugar transferase (PEP-CTERM/EpsH1 system associated)
MAMPADPRALVVHVVYRFDTGGLENGVVNLINHMPSDVYRHVVLSLTEVTAFKQRVQRPDVEFIALHKPPGHGAWQWPKLFRLFRQLRPAIVHSRNLAALETQVAAWAAGVPVRIHGEHGRDVEDLDGSNLTYQRVRRAYRPFVHHYIALSRDLAGYLAERVHVPATRMTQIYNGVDTNRFAPSPQGVQPIAHCPFDPQQHLLVGTVGRMQAVKDQATLVHAFALALQQAPQLRQRLRLVLVGDGAQRPSIEQQLEQHGVADLAWLAGERSDVPAIMQGLHTFVLPSRAEGISNTILEAMACGLPVVATAVGGNADLVAEGETGWIVPAADPASMAQALLRLAQAPERAHAMGQAGRRRVLERFSLQAMVRSYQTIYDQQLRRTGVALAHEAG